MKESGCENEGRILEALGHGLMPETLEGPLRRHVEACDSCTELVRVYELFQSDIAQVCAVAPVPEAGRVWWRAMLAARRAEAERALRPIVIAEKAALAVGAGALIALLIFATPWLAEQLARPSVFSRTVVYTLPLSSLLVASIIICLLLTAGALYTLWAEK